MSKLLIVEESIIVQALFRDLLEGMDGFSYDIVSSYKEAELLLKKSRYEFAIVERVLKDAKHGEIIALFNKFNIAPLVFTSEIDEDFFDDFEGAYIVDYIKKVKHNNEEAVLQRVKQLKANKHTTILVVSDSIVYGSYLQQNLKIHNFKVFAAKNNEEAYEKLQLHPETALVIVDNNEPYVNSMQVVEHIRKNRALNSCNIIVLSEESNSYFTGALLSAGANDYLIKEFSRSEFYVRIYQNINKLC